MLKYNCTAFSSEPNNTEAVRRLPVSEGGAVCVIQAEMFRIAKGYDHVTKTIRIPEPLARELEQLAADNSLSLNQLVIQCIQYALDHATTDENTDCKQK